MLKNLVREDLKGEERRFDRTLFPIFLVTKDYCSNLHLDIKDYGFGFVIWLHAHGDIELEYLPTFWLNGYKIKFQPSHRLAFLLKILLHQEFDARKLAIYTSSDIKQYEEQFYIKVDVSNIFMLLMFLKN
jgi:hypothetical protein